MTASVGGSARAETAFLSRQERFASVGSTNDVVAGWLRDGVPEVCVVVADEQTAGRGRAGRTWQAPPGRALLLSVGFRPRWIPADRAWRVPATVSLAMADAAEEAAGLADGSVRLKWPNDLVVESSGESPPGEPSGLPASPSSSADHAAATRPTPALRKLGGVLGEAQDLGSAEPRLVVGLGVNADWSEAEFPRELAGTMTSLRVASGGRPIDLARLLDAFLLRLEPRIEALRSGWFDVAGWTERQVTTGRTVELELPDGRREEALAIGVDALGGGLVLRDPATGGERTIVVGDVVHVRLAPPV